MAPSSAIAIAIASSSSSFVSLCNTFKQVLPSSSSSSSSSSPASPLSVSWSPLRVESSSRPRKKCTAHHNKTRPKKHNPSDKNRKPAVYPKPPKAPPAFTLGWGDEAEEGATPSAPPTVLAEA